jgi:REP element-mobilizing transposase RayT
VAAVRNESSQFLWLRNHFKYESLRSRVLLYDYDAQKLLAPGIAREATVLINNLIAERQASHADERPLIFLCHGFGGLLLQRALALTRGSNSPPERFQALRSSTYAVIFAGTPHRGINQDALGVLYRDSSKPPNQFVLDLIRDSDVIEEIASDFQPFLKEIRIVNFWEQVPSVNGKASAIIVEEQSAAPMEYTLERCGIMSDHAHLLNFSSSNDAGFNLVNSALESCLKESARRLQQKAAKTYEQTVSTRQGSQSRPQGHNMWQNEITGRAVHLGDVYVYNTIDSTALVRQQDTTLVPSLSDMYGKLPRSGCEMYKVERASSPQFTGRRLQADILLNGLRSNAAETREKHRIAVIYGLGGSGKTQFCLRFAEQHRSR